MKLLIFAMTAFFKPACISYTKNAAGVSSIILLHAALSVYNRLRSFVNILRKVCPMKEERSAFGSVRII
jgi:hypothetical protein